MNRRAKGSRLEYDVRDAFIEAQWDAKRIPFSGSLGGDLDCDVKVRDPLALPLTPWRNIECKSLKDGWPKLYKLLEKNWALVLKADRKDALIVMRLKDYL